LPSHSFRALNVYPVPISVNQVADPDRGLQENTTDPDMEHGTLSQTVIDDMEDMFA